MVSEEKSINKIRMIMTYHGSWQGIRDKQKSTEKKQTYEIHHAAEVELRDALACRTT